MNLLLITAGNLPLGEPSTDRLWEISIGCHMGNILHLSPANPMTATGHSVVDLWNYYKETCSPIFTVPYSFLSAGAAKAALMTSFPAPGCLATLRVLNGQRDAEAYLWPDAVNLEGHFQRIVSLNLKKMKPNSYIQLDIRVTSIYTQVVFVDFLS